MGISIGGIDLAEATIDAQHRLGLLEKLVEHVLSKLPAGTITQALRPTSSVLLPRY